MRRLLAHWMRRQADRLDPPPQTVITFGQSDFTLPPTATTATTRKWI